MFDRLRKFFKKEEAGDPLQTMFVYEYDQCTVCVFPDRHDKKGRPMDLITIKPKHGVGDEPPCRLRIDMPEGVQGEMNIIVYRLKRKPRLTKGQKAADKVIAEGGAGGLG